jgi:thiamine biosynthesis lipoprotein
MSTSIRQFVFEAIGTTWRIDIFEPLDPLFADEILNEVKERIDIFDQIYSRFRRDSLITTISQEAGIYEFPADAEQLFQLYEQLYRLTNGLMTPLIGQVLVEAGYDADYSLQPKKLHHPPSWEDTLLFQAPTTLTVKRPVVIDVGAMGKGYLIDIVSDLLWQRGLRSYCVDAGGDILSRNATNEALSIALEHPENTTMAIGVAKICNNSICGSAGNRRTWGEFHHIINPETLTSPREILGIWTIAKTTILADAMSTALFFCPAQILQEHFTFDYLIMYPDQTVQASRDFPVELFLDSSSR